MGRMVTEIMVSTFMISLSLFACAASSVCMRSDTISREVSISFGEAGEVVVDVAVVDLLALLDQLELAAATCASAPRAPWDERLAQVDDAVFQLEQGAPTGGCRGR